MSGRLPKMMLTDGLSAVKVRKHSRKSYILARGGVTCRDMRGMRQATCNIVATLFVTVAGVGFADGAAADPGEHEVTYTITAATELWAQIRYMAADPPNMTVYAENMPAYIYTSRPKVSPDVPWSYTAKLVNPSQWAIVNASDQIPLSRSANDVREGADPQFRCQIAIDGQVVVSQQGGREVSCTIREW
jgi:hypothetical protein